MLQALEYCGWMQRLPQDLSNMQRNIAADKVGYNTKEFRREGLKTVESLAERQQRGADVDGNSVR